MKQRRWIIETTGEDRPVKQNEYYINFHGHPDNWILINPSFSNFDILTCVEICLHHSLPLPCGICDRIEEEYRQAMIDRKTMGD